MILISTNLTGRMLIQGEKSDSFNIQRGLKQGDGLLNLFLNFVLEDVVRNTQDKIVLSINRMMQFIVFADDVIISRREIYNKQSICYKLQQKKMD